jgi:predicted nucleic acid-binding protein
MSASFIVDCSLAMAWLFKDEATSHTARLLRRLDSESMLVPALWFLELTNVMVLAERHRRITVAESAEFILELSKLDIEIDAESPERTFEALLPLCRIYRLTSYDAAYLELAVRRRLPLATLDGPLRKAARRVGVKLLGR